MAGPLPVLIIDSNRENQNLLQTILSFIGESCEVFNGDATEKLPGNYKGVVLGEIAPSEIGRAHV